MNFSFLFFSLQWLWVTLDKGKNIKLSQTDMSMHYPPAPLSPTPPLPPRHTHTQIHIHWRKQLSLSLLLKNMVTCVVLSEGCWPTLRNFNGLREKKWNHGRHARDQMLSCSITWCLCNYSISNLLYDITVPRSIHKMIKAEKLLWLSWKAMGWMNEEFWLHIRWN